MGFTEQTVENTGYVGVAAADSVNHFDVPIRFLFIEGICAGIIDDGTKGMETGTVDYSLCGRDDGDGVVLGEAFEDGFRVPFFVEGQTSCVFRTKKDVYQRENLLNAGFGLETGLQILAVIYIEGDECPVFFEETNHFYGGVLAKLA